ncbi:Putative copper-binding protein [Saliniradius amylolyticus]|uniref:Copper-binding protein n=1 Tax=Saliniradius amylolyticus TaxID=2183582 RepID=A0A2S2E4A3_9ALTE|nr:SCO family protein [Saliniradius amylolyticus]AWL12481.1 Putative copper-binding protein [Saliniradius amylolyticus]
MLLRNLLGLTVLAVLVGIIFSIPLLPMQSQNAVSHEMLNDIDRRHAIVFFGFTGCKDVCPTSLAVLRKVLALQKTKPDTPTPAVIFVDIDANSNQRLAERYAKQFDERFIGYHANEQELAKLSQLFGLNISQKGEQINHRGRTYLLEKRNGRWWVDYAINPQGLTADGLINELRQES